MDKFKYGMILFFASQSLYALTTCNVTLDTDNNSGGIGDNGDLRYCLNTMNQNLNSTPDDYAITFANPMTIQLNGILPVINNSSNAVNITIGNPGSTPTVTIDGNGGTYSGFFIPMGSVTIQNMIFQNLTAKGGNGGDGISGGAAGTGAYDTAYTVQGGSGGVGGGGGVGGTNGSALGNSIFLRSGSSLNFVANGTNDLLTLGDQVAFTDDTSFGGGATSVFVKGNGTVVYNETTNYQGSVTINNANFKVNGQINTAAINVCRNVSFSSQRGTLSGIGTLTGDVLANSGTISPDAGGTLTLGRLTLNSASSGTLGSLVHIDINSSGGTSLVAVTGSASLAGILEINLDANAHTGTYTILTSSSGITGTFDSVRFTGTTPRYTISYLPAGSPTYVQFNYIGSSVDIPATVNGSPIINPAVVCCGRPVLLGPLPVPGSGPTVYNVTHHTGDVTCQISQTSSQTYLKMYGKNGSCTIVGTKDGVVSNPLTVIASA